MFTVSALQHMYSRLIIQLVIHHVFVMQFGYVIIIWFESITQIFDIFLI